MKSVFICCVIYDLYGFLLIFEDVLVFIVDDFLDVYEWLIDWFLEFFWYGEKWVWYWLDLVCYVEINSYECDGVKLFVWCYWDYVICLFNDDKFYDWFVIE